MKINSFLIILFGALIILSCKKDKVNPQEHDIPKIAEFDTCLCSVSDIKGNLTEFISAEINEVLICFEKVISYQDTFFNTIRYGYVVRDTGNQYYDNVVMGRKAANSDWSIAIFLENTHAYTKTYPYDLPRQNSEYCEIGGIQLNSGRSTPCYWCDENPYNYYGPFFADYMKMTVTSFTDNFFEGTFSGVTKSGGRYAFIKNGKFRIRLIPVNVNIILNGN